MWKTFKKEREKSRIEKRVDRLPTAELITWSDQILYSIGRNLTAWQRSQNKSTLEEALMGAEAIHAIAKALHERSTK
jgi:hypothetical protein